MREISHSRLSKVSRAGSPLKRRSQENPWEKRDLMYIGDVAQLQDGKSLDERVPKGSRGLGCFIGSEFV